MTRLDGCTRVACKQAGSGVDLENLFRWEFKIAPVSATALQSAFHALVAVLLNLDGGVLQNDTVRPHWSLAVLQNGTSAIVHPNPGAPGTLDAYVAAIRRDIGNDM